MHEWEEFVRYMVSPFYKGGISKFNMSVEGILMHFEAFFFCETKLILQALVIFQMLTTAFLNLPHHQCMRWASSVDGTKFHKSVSKSNS